ERFEGRSSLRTWIFRILMNRAITRGQRERRSVPFSALADPGRERNEPAVDPEWFQGPGGRHPGGWRVFPASWAPVPEERLLSKETMAVIERALQAMPPGQREVLVMRDVEGMTSGEA